MKYLRQFLIILGISFVGELLKVLLPLPIPASIYGMVILFIGLLTGWIPLDAVRDAGKFLIEIMPGHVYSGGSRVNGIVGNFKTDAASGQYHCGRDTDHSHGCDRLVVAVDDPEREKRGKEGK